MPTPGSTILVAHLRGALVAIVGVVILLLPWERWHPRTTLVIPAVGLVSLTFGDYMHRFASAGTGQRLLPVIYMLIFVWLGMMHGRWWPLRVLPLAACGYLYAACLAPDPDAARITALVFLPIAVLLGEVIAWVLDRLDSAQDRDAARIRSLERLADATFELHESALLDAPRVAASSAAAVLDSDGVLVAIRSGDDVLRGTAGAAPQLSADDVGVLLCGGTTAPQNALVVPLRPPGPYAAVLVAKATNSRDEFSSNVARLLGMQFGSAIARLQQVEQLRRDANTDALTGVGNRRDASRFVASVGPGDAVVLVDLDHFKGVNDTFGHAAGDEVLRQLGAYLSGALRPTDCAARYGGEEFLVLLRGCEGAQAWAAAERLRRGWCATGPVTTFSVGVAVHVKGRTPEQTVELADRALYGAKGGGRDRVNVYCDDATVSLGAPHVTAAPGPSRGAAQAPVR